MARRNYVRPAGAIRRYVVRVDGLPARSGSLREMQRLARDLRTACKRRKDACEISLHKAYSNALVTDYSVTRRRK